MSSYLTAAEVAARWRCAPSSVTRLARRGLLAGMRLGVEWRFSLAAVEAYELAQTSAPTPVLPERKEAPVTASASLDGWQPADPVFPELWGLAAPTKRTVSQRL